MSGRAWTRPEVNEALVTLYLRLNGYFTTGLVVQAPDWGEARTEIDCLALRHPGHAQPEREVPSSPFLALQPGLIDLLICEVKSVPAEVSFNPRLKRDPAVVKDVLRWAGVFSEGLLPELSDRVLPLLQDGVTAEAGKAGLVEGSVRVRGLLCCPPAEASDLAGRWCLLGSELVQFANTCFNPKERRPSCSTRYNFRLWSGSLAPLVQYFKALRHRERISGRIGKRSRSL